MVVAGRRRVLGPAAQPFGQVIRHTRLAQPCAERVTPRVERVEAVYEKEKPAVVVNRWLSIGSFNWHPLGESNPSLQDENLMS